MKHLLLMFYIAFGCVESISINFHGKPRERLESYNVAAESVSVSGLSSGGGFVSNFFVAHSASLKGAGSFAGVGPYGCGATKNDGCKDIDSMVDYAHEQAERGLIDPVIHLDGKPFYVFHGDNDWMVHPSRGQATADFFQAMGCNLKSNLSNICGHGIPSLDRGVRCHQTWMPGVNNCGWSGAFHVMNHIYGDLRRPAPFQPLPGEWVEFDQTEFTEGIPRHSFAHTGFAYFPSGCLNETKECKLHVSVHGCFILSWVIGDKYALSSGHNEVGELNDIIILHPQLTTTFKNFFGCWGIEANAGTKEGVEVKVVMRMIQRILGNQ